MRYEIHQERLDGTLIGRASGRYDSLVLDHGPGLEEWQYVRNLVYSVAKKGAPVRLRIIGWGEAWSQERHYDGRGRLIYDSGIQYKDRGIRVRHHRSERKNFDRHPELQGD